MPITCLLESAFKWLFLGSLVLLAVSYWQKDDLPPPETFDRGRLDAPIQTPTDRDPFTVYARPDAVYIDGALMYDRADPARQPVFDFELGQSSRGDAQ